MDKNQQYVTNLLYKVPSWELSDPQQQDAFEKIRVSLSNTMDFPGQLKALYKVTDMSNLALGLMWITEKVDRDPSKLESTAEEESFILGLLKGALGGAPGASTGTELPAEQSFGVDVPRPAVIEQSSFPDAAIEAPAPGGGTVPSAAPMGMGDATEQGFAGTLERLVEAIQGGSGERTALIDDLTSQAEEIVASSSSDTEYKTFCGYLIEFLKYVLTNELFDDIRVMNLLSNVYDPFSQWARTDPSGRAGILEQANETLRDFKALFE